MRAVALAFMVTETNFTPAWSNPIWESLNYSVVLESARILELAGSVATLLPPAHDDAMLLTHPGPLMGVDPNVSLWPRRLAAVVGGFSATAVCLACAFGFQATREALEDCWARCAAFAPGYFAANVDGEGTDSMTVLLPTEHYVLVNNSANNAAPSGDTATARTPRQGA